MKEVRIQNEYVEAVVSQQGAEIISFKRKDNGIETIWSRDPAYWTNCNPILFPYTGPLKDGHYEYNGKTYELGQHGFARRAVFEFDDIQEDRVTLSLTYNEETMKVYPFRFRITVNYRLEGYKIINSYTISNLDECDLPFSLGFHPAFNCPLTEEGKYEDYRIEFEVHEDLHHKEKDLTEGDSFDLEHNLVSGSFFYDDHQLKSRWSQLTDGKHTIRVGNEGFATLGFWRKTDTTPFMCIEPWFPDSDLKKKAFFRDDKLNDLLPPGEEFKCQYYFELVK